MKKIYINLFTLGLATMFSGGLMAQTDAQLNTNHPSDDVRASLMYGAQPRTDILSTQKACDDSLTTPLEGGNSFSGNMFDVTVGANPITVETFWVSMDTDDQVRIYYKTGTFVGSESTPGDWTYLDSAFTTGAGVGAISAVPVSLGLNLSANTDYAFYVTQSIQSDFNYTNGTTVGAVRASNADLTIFEGNGGGLFSVTFSPRMFNGAIQYCLNTGGIDESSIADNLTLYPNPASTELNIDLSDFQLNNSSVAIYNMLGALVAEENLSVTANNVIDISNLEAGVYFVSIDADGTEISKKLIVE